MSDRPAAQAEQHAGGGWRARLDLQFQRSSLGTRLTRRRHSGPLLVQRAFYPEGGSTATAGEPCHVYILHPPGGVVSGDELSVDVDVQSGAHALLTTPAAGKFYRRGVRRVSRLTQTLGVNAGALEWLPQENIFYPDAAADLRTVVQLTGDARFIGWEVGCLGLPANGASLGGGEVRHSFELWHDRQPLWLERTHVERAGLAARWGLAGHAALGTWLAFPAGPAQLRAARASIANCADATLACTLVDGALVCRALAQRADRLKAAFMALWSALRPMLLARAAVPPRIWAT